MNARRQLPVSDILRAFAATTLQTNRQRDMAFPVVYQLHDIGEGKRGTVWGIVLGNKPIRSSELEETFGVTGRTIRDWIKRLEEHGYIRVTRAPYGLIFSVRNSKKYQNRPEVNFHSDDGDRKKTSDLEDGDRKKTSDHPEENFRSNKDIIKILIDRWIDGLEEDDQKELSSKSGVLSTAVGAVSTGKIDFDKPTVEQRVLQIEQYYLQRNGLLSPVPTDWEHVREIANEAMPLDLVYFFIDLAIARKKAKRRRPSDKIRTFSYCKTVIYGCWDELSSFLERYLTPCIFTAGNSRPGSLKRASKKPTTARN